MRIDKKRYELKLYKAKKVPLKYCLVSHTDRVEVQLYVQYRGKRLVLIQNVLPKVLSEIANAYSYLRDEISKEIPGMDKDAVLKEVDRIFW